MRLRISIEAGESVSGLLDVPKNAFALVVLAHGAGAGMDHSGMNTLRGALNAKGIATLRFQFLYMEKKRKRPDFPAVAIKAIEAAVNEAAKRTSLPIFVGGKSFGGRMTTTAAAQGKLVNVRGILCFGFPLHPPKKPGIARAEHLAQVKLPVLWIQGLRDTLADPPLVRKVTKKNGIQLHFIEGADHGYGVLKRTGRTPEQVWSEVGEISQRFCRDLLSKSNLLLHFRK